MDIISLKGPAMLRKSLTGFTIVELLVVVAVIAILAGFSVLGFSGWRTRAAQNEVKSDLKNVATAMESAKNYGSGYPSSIPATFKSSANVTVSLQDSTSTSYCIRGQSTKVSSVFFTIRNGQSEPGTSVCV